MPYFNPDLTNNLLPTPAQIKKYLRNINSKNKRDSRQLMSFLQRLQEVDGYLGGLILTRKRAVKSFKYDIRLPLEFKSTPTEEKQLQDTRTRFRRSKMIETFDDIIDGILFGMSAVNLKWDNTRYGTMVVRKETYDLTELDYSDAEPTLLEVVTEDNGNVFKRDLDPEVTLITRCNPMKNRKNYIGSFMRMGMILCFLKYNTRWAWSDNNDRHGVPSTYATHPDGLDESEINKIIAMVEKLKKDSVAVFPEYVKLLYDEALKSDQADSFDKFVTAANTELAVLFHGQNLTTEVKQGSKAAATVHNEIDDIVIDGDIETITTNLSEQYLIQDYINNYGTEPRNDYFELIRVREGQEDYESNSRIISNIMSDPNLSANLPLKKSQIYRKLGLEEPEDDADVIKIAQPKSPSLAESSSSRAESRE